MTAEPTVVRSQPSPHAALLTINRPARLGARMRAMRDTLAGHWKAVRAEPEITAVGVTGMGRGFFSTGLDVVAAAEGDDPNTWYGGGGDDAVPAFGLSPLDYDVWVPLVVAVNGVRAGGGFHLLTDADVVVASEDATFLDLHVSVGQVPALEPIALLRRLEPVLRMVVLGRHGRLTSADALRVVLVSEVVPPWCLLSRVIELAEAAARNSPAAIEASKRAIRQSLNLGPGDGLQAGWRALRDHWNHPDCREGVAAFAEGR